MRQCICQKYKPNQPPVVYQKHKANETNTVDDSHMEYQTWTPNTISCVVMPTCGWANIIILKVFPDCKTAHMVGGPKVKTFN